MSTFGQSAYLSLDGASEAVAAFVGQLAGAGKVSIGDADAIRDRLAELADQVDTWDWTAEESAAEALAFYEAALDDCDSWPGVSDDADLLGKVRDYLASAVVSAGGQVERIDLGSVDTLIIDTTVASAETAAKAADTASSPEFLIGATLLGLVGLIVIRELRP